MINFRKYLFVTILFLSYSAAQAQRLNTGISMDFYGMSITRFPSDVFFSETSYAAYYIKQLQAPSGFQLANYGFNIIIDYSRFFVNTRVNLSLPPQKGVIYKYSYPIGGNEFSDWYTAVFYMQTEVSASFGYFLNAQWFFKPYIETGIGRTFPYFYREDFSFEKSFDHSWSDHNVMREYLGLYKSYNYLMLGFGFRGDMFSAYTRYNIRLGDQSVYYSTLSFGIAVYTKFSKLRKHYIFQPEE
jgi:hypothetical protein